MSNQRVAFIEFGPGLGRVLLCPHGRDAVGFRFYADSVALLPTLTQTARVGVIAHGPRWTEAKLWREEETGPADFLHAYWMGRYYGFYRD